MNPPYSLSVQFAAAAQDVKACAERISELRQALIEAEANLERFQRVEATHFEALLAWAERQRDRPSSEAGERRLTFHQAWGAAKDRDDYDKDAWKRAEVWSTGKAQPLATWLARVSGGEHTSQELLSFTQAWDIIRGYDEEAWERASKQPVDGRGDRSLEEWLDVVYHGG